ncbi:hypothetical protein REPUB_Repub16aG0098300 [Reevesia pubescens]
MDLLNVLEDMKAELGLMREEKICMETKLIAVESAVEEIKRELSDCKALQKWTNDLLDEIISPLAGGDNVQNLDEETMKGYIEEAMRNLSEAESRWRRSADAGNGGGHVGSTGDDHSKEAGGSHDGNKGGNGGWHVGSAGDDHSNEAGGSQGGNGGGHVGSTGDDHSKEAGGSHGGNKGEKGGGQPE